MTDHNVFYYPYASFTNAQLPLLKVAALYFDKLVLLDPVGASWGAVGADHVARDAVRLLKGAGILEIVSPATVLAKYEAPIAAAIRRDMGDREFLGLCDAQGQASGKQRWTLFLAKVPQDVQTDQTMRHLMGEFAREVARDSGQYREQAGGNPSEYYEYAETGQAYDEYREGDGGGVEYRYADFPLALGEAIMMNHALFAGLLHAGATPITDDPFHSRALAHKLQRAAQEPAIRQVIADRTAQRQLKAGALAAAALTDSQIRLPILNPAIPLEEVLEYRQRHPEALAKVRDTLGLMARRIQAEPWSTDFEREIETQTLPDLIEQLNQATKSRDAWLGSQSTKQWLKAGGIAVGAASAVLAVVMAPVTPVALAAAGLTLASGTAIPGAEWLLDWRDGKKSLQENGLHYLLRT
ncbi:MAG: hypothetical protein HYR85_25050 [Planctomycetes bacterium]|nr:hypothetical protein [Planctomycetota bacterium]MBI3843285.1 hypothetical protein [Planctomycetota bacterium]